MKKNYEHPALEQALVMTTAVYQASQQGQGGDGDPADIKHESLDWGDLW